MSRMFKSIDKTWNVFVGCEFECSYCNARKAALTRLKESPRYKDGFKPHLVEAELKRTFRPGQFIFVAYMGDIAFASRRAREVIYSRICQFPHTYFLIQTKNPECFRWWRLPTPVNVYLGTTIETNRDYHLTKAPQPIERFRQLTGYPHNLKFLSIEPIMDFDLEELTQWVKLLQPDIIEVGADNYHNHLPEPPWGKVERLLESLRGICPKVIEKEGLERLKGGHDVTTT
ncbi:hypothetical protein ES703_53656 [subsurface metagenome]